MLVRFQGMRPIYVTDRYTSEKSPADLYQKAKNELTDLLSQKEFDTAWLQTYENKHIGWKMSKDLDGIRVHVCAYPSTTYELSDLIDEIANGNISEDESYEVIRLWADRTYPQNDLSVDESVDLPLDATLNDILQVVETTYPKLEEELNRRMEVLKKITLDYVNKKENKNENVG